MGNRKVYILPILYIYDYYDNKKQWKQNNVKNAVILGFQEQRIQKNVLTARIGIGKKKRKGGKCKMTRTNETEEEYVLEIAPARVQDLFPELEGYVGDWELLS